MLVPAIASPHALQRSFIQAVRYSYSLGKWGKWALTIFHCPSFFDIHQGRVAIDRQRRTATLGDQSEDIVRIHDAGVVVERLIRRLAEEKRAGLQPPHAAWRKSTKLALSSKR
jgi:hypothetical protein